MLASATDTAEDALLDVLDAAVAATLVVNVSGQTYSFAHALVEHALYEVQTPARRVRAHRLVAEAIEEACGADPGVRVGGYDTTTRQATTPGGAGKAIAYARAAGERALAQLAPSDALRWYEQALGLLDHDAGDERLRAALLVGLGNAQRQTGHPAYRETLLDAGRLAEEVGDTDTLVAAVLANGRGFYSQSTGVDAERVAVIEATLAAVGDADSSSRARLLARLAVERTRDGDSPNRRVIADEALSMARRLNDPATLLDVLTARVWTMDTLGTLSERSVTTAEAEQIADRLGDPIGRFWSTRSRIDSVLETAELSEYVRCVNKLTRLAIEIGQPVLRYISLQAQALRTLLAGDANEAEALAERAFQLGTDTGQPDALPTHAGLIGPIRWHQGRLSELVSLSESMLAAHPTIASIRAGLATVIYADLGREDDAHQLAGRGATSEGSRMLMSCFASTAQPDLLGRGSGPLEGTPAAAELALYEPPPRSHGPTESSPTQLRCSGSVAHCLGHLATVLGQVRRRRSPTPTSRSPPTNGCKRRSTLPAHTSNGAGCSLYAVNPGTTARPGLIWNQL